MGSQKSLDIQHLYILSNDEIKESDYQICIDPNNPHYNLISQKPNNAVNSGAYKKIIATTDSSLKLNSVKIPVSSDFTLEQISENMPCLPQIPQQFIEHFINEYNKGNVISKVLIEVNPELSELFKFQLTKGYLNKYGWYYSYSHSFDKNKDTYYTDKEGEKYLKNGGSKKLKELKFLITEYKHDKNLIKESKPYHSGLKVNSSNEISILTEQQTFNLDINELSDLLNKFATYTLINADEDIRLSTRDWIEQNLK
jgi:hypothetical protein